MSVAHELVPGKEKWTSFASIRRVCPISRVDFVVSGHKIHSRKQGPALGAGARLVADDALVAHHFAIGPAGEGEDAEDPLGTVGADDGHGEPAAL